MFGDCSKGKDSTLQNLVRIPRMLEKETLEDLGVFVELVQFYFIGCLKSWCFFGFFLWRWGHEKVPKYLSVSSNQKSANPVTSV